MANAIALIERELDRSYMPSISNILTAVPSLPAVAFRASFLEEMRRVPALQDCTQQSLFNCAITFSFLAVQPGGATGQCFMLPFRDTKQGVVNAVPVIGYKGYNTLAARSGLGIEAAVVRKDDDYKFVRGTHPRIHHESNLEKSDAQIIGAWSLLVRGEHRFSPVVMGIKQLMQVKAKSAGARKADSPWNDNTGPGFEAMCEKTVRRRQARAIPLNAFLLADGMETQHDLGRPAWVLPRPQDGAPAIITDDGVQHPPKPEKTTIDLPPKNLKLAVVVGQEKSGKLKVREVPNIDEWEYVMTNMIKKTPQFAHQIRKANSKQLYDLAEAGFEANVHRVVDLLNEAEGAKKR